MAKTYLTGSLPAAAFGNIIKLKQQAPVDGRMVVDSYSDISGTAFKTLFVEDGVNTWYPGMLVVTKNTGKVYILKSESEGFVEIGVDLTSLDNTYVKKTDLVGLYKIKGVVDEVSQLPKKEDATIGDVYNVRKRFTAILLKLDPVTGKLSTATEEVTYPAGTNVVLVKYKDASGSEVLKWDALGGVSDFDWVDV